jgi:prepilin-type N-terminal cleavage/methylation domain
VTSPARQRAGFTLLELIAVVTIVLILIFLFVGVARRLPGIADRVVCTGNLRALHVGFETYVQDNNHWPKVPRFGPNGSEAEGEWWIRTMAPYDIPEKAWQCPAIIRLGKIQQNGTTPKIHYAPMIFDQRPRTPYLWPNQPWLVEIANVHGHGALCILPDGSVKDWDKHFAEHLAR